METINLNAQTEEGRAMAEKVKALYTRASKVLSVHCTLNKMAMAATQSLGYNGFKRWHRCNSKCLFDSGIKLANALYDKFRIKAEFSGYELTYEPKSLEEHLRSWEKALLDGIQELGTVQKEYCELSGMRSEVLDCSLSTLTHDYEKVGRYLKRFSESDWLALDMHIVDDRLHDKYKEKEEGYSGLWNSMVNYGFGKK